MICAYKSVGGAAKVCDVLDPRELFRSNSGCDPIVIPIGNASEGLYVMVADATGIGAEVNLEVEGTLLYGAVLFIGRSDEGLVGLTDKQLDYLKHYTLVE